MTFYKVLFYDKGYREPIDCRSIIRLLQAFPRNYSEVVKIIVENSESFSENAFRSNIAFLLPSFRMTRGGIFKGIDVDKEGCIHDSETGVIDSCWKKIGYDLWEIRKYIDKNAKVHKRSRRLAELSEAQRKYVIRKTGDFFKALCDICASKGQKRHARVGASKILFAVLPEVALPVDNVEWKDVFKKTDEYEEILTIMADDIDKWERITNKHLDGLEDNPHKSTTLPSIYNVLAMSIRPLEKLPMPKIRKKYNAYLRRLKSHQ